MKMRNSATFALLEAFLGQAEVEGRARKSAPREFRRKLQLMARGKLPEKERMTMAELLREHPEWLPTLAAEVKKLRRGNHA